MAENRQSKRGPGRPPGSKNKAKDKTPAPSVSNAEKIEQMQAKYDRDRRNVDVIWSITLFAVGVFLFFTVVMDTTGAFGMAVHDVCMGLFGLMAYVLPFLFIIFALLLMTRRLQHAGGRTIFFSLLIFINLCILNSYRFIDEKALSFGFADIAEYYVKAVKGEMGGAVGMELGTLLVKFFGKPGLLIISLSLIVISLFLVANTPISRFFEDWSKKREAKRLMREMEEAEIDRIQKTVAAAATPGADPVTGAVKGARAEDMQDTLILSDEGEKKSFWKSILNGIMKSDEPVPVPAQTRHYIDADPDIPVPFAYQNDHGSRAGSTAASASNIRQTAAPEQPGLDERSLPAQKNDSVMEALKRDTFFGRIAKKFSAAPDYNDNDDGDYGYPGKRINGGSGNTGLTGLSNNASLTDDGAGPGTGLRGSVGMSSGNGMPKTYGLGDPEDFGHSGSYGLGGSTAAAAGSFGSDNAKAAEPDTAPRRSRRNAGTGMPADAARYAAKASSGGAKGARAKNSLINTEEDVKSREKLPPETEDEIKAETDALTESFNSAADDPSYVMPPVSLLKKPAGNRQMASDYQLEQKADTLEKTLNDFGVDAKVMTVTQGASVTRYEVKPATGVKVSSITKLADDIALNMRAKSIRIEAPIPGKAAVGIEVENDKPSPVLIRELIESAEFQQSSSKISFTVGKDISGNNIVADLKEMPHLLIAGATGSGKSICINTIITSFLYKARPSELKLIMIDPKVVELANYNGIPHMLTPVVTDPRKASRALAIAVEEMDKRYELFAKEGVKDLESYNELMRANHEYASCKPQVVIIIDELADLMMAAPSEVENSICRLAQKARAAGMHLIVATQRPSVDVVTGLIKANIPSRIAFSVASQFDSRTILDMAGAEKLLGKGDMLFSPVGSNKPYRVQGPFISESESDKVISFVKKEGGTPDYDEELRSAIENADKKNASAPQDELTEDAIAFIFKSKQGSVSMLQRRFRIGYNRAARIIDEIEEKGIIGPSDGSKARKLLITEEEYYGSGEEEEETVHVDAPKADEAIEYNKEVVRNAIDSFNSLPESVQKAVMDSDHQA